MPIFCDVKWVSGLAQPILGRFSSATEPLLASQAPQLTSAGHWPHWMPHGTRPRGHRDERKRPAKAREDAKRGAASLDEARDWLKARGIEDIECVVPDQAGVARGKMMPVSKFLAGPTMSMPGSILDPQTDHRRLSAR